MWSVVGTLVTHTVGAIAKNFASIGAYFAGKTAEKEKRQRELLKVKRKQEKIRNKNKKATVDDLLKKAKKYRRDK